MTPLNRFIFQIGLTAGLVALPLAAQTVTISGGGNYISGSGFYLGTHSGTPSGLVVTYNDAAADVVTFRANRVASWLWENYDDTTTLPSMRLDQSNNLILYNGTDEGVKLNPVAKSLKLGTHANGTLTADANGKITTGGEFAVAGNFTNAGGSLTGGGSGLALHAGGTNQNISLNATGTGDLVFNAGSVERMRVRASGNVGVGTSTPAEKFEIANGHLLLSNNYTIKFRDNTGVPNAYFYYDYIGAENRLILMNASSTGGIHLFAGGGSAGSEKLTILPGGNVGIGTVAPASPLDIYNPAAGTETLRISQANVAQGLAWYSAVPGAPSAERNWALLVNAVVYGDFSFRQSNAKGGNPIAAGTDRLYLDGAGNVGIGTSTPGSRKLNVQSSDPGNDVGVQISQSRETGTNYGLIVSSVGTGAAVNYGLLATAANGTANIGVRIHNVAAGPDSHALYSDSSAPSYFQGHVGIGTISPAGKLTVAGQHDDTSLRLFSDHFGQGKDGANTALLNLWASEPFRSWTGVGIGNNMINGPSGIARVTTTRGGSYIRLLENHITFNTVDAAGEDRSGLNIVTGHVGIGTTDPGIYLLAVKGKIRAEEIVVDTDWADYVFAEDYRLAPLAEVEAHIREKKHLPGIPSAAEVAEHGVSMGEMQSRLLAKVEELTLHLIRMEKENTDLRQRVQTLEAASLSAGRP